MTKRKKICKLDQTCVEDYVFHVSIYDEKEILINLGFSGEGRNIVLEYNPYRQEGWDD